MKPAISLFLLSFLIFSTVLHGATREDVVRLSRLEGDSYVEERNRIVAEGGTSIALLTAIRDDPKEEWYIRVAAGVCLERIERHADILYVRSYDLSTHPKLKSFYEYGWNIPVNGVPKGSLPVFGEVLAEYGLWYSYLEILAEKSPHEWHFPAYRFIGGVLYEHAQGIYRYFTAKIAEEKNCYLLGKLVLDGSYPEGARQTIRDCPDLFEDNPEILLSRVSDISFLEKLKTRYSLQSYYRQLCDDRISAIRAGHLEGTVPTNALMLSGIPAPRSSLAPSPENISAQEEKKDVPRREQEVGEISVAKQLPASSRTMLWWAGALPLALIVGCVILATRRK